MNNLEKATDKVASIMLKAKEEAVEKRNNYGLFLTPEIMRKVDHYEEGYSTTLSMIADKYANHDDNVDGIGSKEILEYLESELPSYASFIADLEPITMDDISKCISEVCNGDINGFKVVDEVLQMKHTASYWDLILNYYRQDVRNGASFGVSIIDVLFPRMSICEEAEKEILSNPQIPNDILETAKIEVEVMNDPTWKAYINAEINKKYKERFKNNFYRLEVSY